jgi:hypothetical protein
MVPLCIATEHSLDDMSRQCGPRYHHTASLSCARTLRVLVPAIFVATILLGVLSDNAQQPHRETT